jgi:hypothetical protein
VGAQILHDTDIRDPTDERPLPSRRDLIQVTQVPGGDPFPHAANRRVEPFHVANTPDNARTIKSIYQLIGLNQIIGDRLLYQGVYSGLGQCETTL